jgi:hypothetical protein
MDRKGLFNQRLTKRGKHLGRIVRIVNRDESVGVVYVRHIGERSPISPFARNHQQQRAQPTQKNARTSHCVRAFVCRTVSKAGITSWPSRLLRVQSA